ncbi:MAG: OmpA family protein [Kofleriaceae bacterium]
MANDDTGIIVSPPHVAQKPRVLSTRGAAPRAPRLVTAAWLAVATGVGAGGSYLAMQRRLAADDTQIAGLSTRAKLASEDAARAQAQATTLAADLEIAKAKTEKAEQELSAEKAAAAKLIADKASETKALESKLSAVLAGQGEVSQADGSIRLELVDKVLFAVGQSELTERGKRVLGKVGEALLEVKDKQIWVQGHTDDLPITPDKGKGKGAKPTFETNWELAAARALTVVHYLQDVSKVEPHRLAAVAFGQYRPISRARAKNRRIEIVLYPKLDVKPR